MGINNIEISSDDWVGAFNGDVCVGARKWDISQCGGGVCDLPIMGYDGSNLTEGYMLSGQIPTFKIFDASNLEYVNALPSEEIEFVQMGSPIIDSL